MRLIARGFLICLVIPFIICGLKAKPSSYPKPASCESGDDCLKGKAKCVRRECQCNNKYGYGDGKAKCDKWTACKQSLCDKISRNSYCLANPNDKLMTTCRCNSGYFGRPNEPRCMKAEKTGGKYPCLTNKNCATYAYCHDGMCLCSDELYGDGEKCKARPVKCSSKRRTCNSKKGQCVEGKCRCVGEYFGNGDYCREPLPCPEDVNCGAGKCVIDPLFPKKPVCVCYPDTVKTKDKKCEEKKCKDDSECTKKYSKCKEGRCACEEELILGKKSCKPAPLHVCNDDKDCHSQAKCQDGKCVCQGNRTGNGKNCRDSDPCNKDCGPGGTCLKETLLKDDDPVCRCNKGYNRLRDGKCVECIKHTDCSYGSCTTKGECKCALELVKEGRICKRAPLHPCKPDGKDCHENATCFRGKCHCLSNTTGSGKYCRDSLRCKKEDAEKCNAGGNNVISCVVDPLFRDQPECKCHLGFKTSEVGICVAITECEEKGEQCSPGRVCRKDKDSDYKCLCKKGFKEISPAEGNSTCQDKDECSEDPCLDKKNSVCKNTDGSFKCECIKGFRMSADESSCEDVDECLHDETLCNKVNEKCLNQQGSFFCVCRSGYRRVNKLCVKKEQCIFKCTQYEICVAGECKCKDGYKKSGIGYCVPRRHHLDESLGLSSLHSIGFPSTLFICVLGYLAFTD